MVIVTASVVAREGQLTESLALSQIHVARSRLELGCISHDVLLHPDQPDRLIFLERWTDMACLAAHFKVPASREFAKALMKLSSQAPEMNVYETKETSSL